jgi:photosystem II stability/assembly factor-like uncharacterized protein
MRAFKIISFLFVCFFIGRDVLGQEKTECPKLVQQLIDEGWHRREVDQLLQNYMHSNSGLSKELEFLGLPEPKQAMLKDIELLHIWADQYQKDYKNFESKYSSSHKVCEMMTAEKVEPKVPLNRQAGIWKHVDIYAAPGRIYDFEVHPDNPNIIYANPDGDGIYKTNDGGLSWSCITDRISDRLHRNTFRNIIVDPKDYNHLFSISKYGNMYETLDGGMNWNRVINSMHREGKAPNFQCVEAYRNNRDSLCLIGTVTKTKGLNHGWKKGVYSSYNNGQTWKLLPINNSNLQEFVFHPENKDVIYLGGQSKLYHSIDAGMSFQLIKDFDFGSKPMFIAICKGENSDALYVAVSEGKNTQVYFSCDGGSSWEKRQDSKHGIGYEHGIFGRDGSGGWTSFFEVDPFDSNHLIASKQSSCESFDGGVTWEFQSWFTRADAQLEDGTLTLSPFCKHMADSHEAKFHPKQKGLVFKACDGGLMRKEEADSNWVNINGNIPAFLWNSVAVNDFGDRYIAGNTQDDDVQFYRYNTWDNEDGYEGDLVLLNPSTNVTYYPWVNKEEDEGLNLFAPFWEWNIPSWGHPKIAVNYQNLDEIYVAFKQRGGKDSKEVKRSKFLYVSYNRGVSFDRVPNMGDKEVWAINVSRTNLPVLTAFTTTDVMQSTDQGESWSTIAYPDEFKGFDRTVKKNMPRCISACVNPVNPRQLWLGGSEGMIYASNDGGNSWKSIKGSLPDGMVLELIFHEGTKGDLYALVDGYGVFHKSAEDDDWQLWLDGYNLAGFRDIKIDYQTQKLLGASYGRGLWEADLENSVDRFFPEGIKICCNGKINGKYVFELDTKLEIPDYYVFHWLVNGKSTGCSSQILHVENLHKGDEVELEISPKYSIDVKQSASFIVDDIDNIRIKKAVRDPLFVKDYYLDAGYVDLFGAEHNITINTRIKPITEGIIAANRRVFYRDAKGWYLEVTKEGQLHFNAAFYQNRILSKTFGKGTDQSLSVLSRDSAIIFNQWADISIEINRKEHKITLFVNGETVGVSEIPAGMANISLNSVMDLTLLADSYGKHKMVAELKEFNIANTKISNKELRHKSSKDVFYIDFKSREYKELYRKKPIVFKKPFKMGEK